MNEKSQQLQEMQHALFVKKHSIETQALDDISKNVHADDCLSEFASPVEIYAFKNLEKREPDQWLQLRNLKWDRWIRDDGSIFGRPKKEVATPKNAPEKENPTQNEVATQLPTATG